MMRPLYWSNLSKWNFIYSNNKSRLFLRRWLLIVFLSCCFISCLKKNPTEENFNGTILFMIAYHHLDFYPETSILVNICVEDKDSVAYFYEVSKKQMIKYDIHNQTLTKGVYVGCDSLNVYFLKMVSSDSIYFNLYPYLLVTNFYQVKKKYYFKEMSHLYPYLYPFFFKNHLCYLGGGKFLIPLSVRYAEETQRSYYERWVNPSNMFGIFKFKDDTIVLDSMLPIKQMFKQSDRIQNIALIPIHTYSKYHKILFFTYNILDTIYSANRVQNFIKVERKRCDFGYPIEPVFYNIDTATNIDRTYYSCGEKQSFVSDLFYDERLNVIYKIIHYKVYNNQLNHYEIKTVVQILSSTLHLIKNVVIPHQYVRWPFYIHSSLIFSRIDKKKKRVYYEKMDNLPY